MSIKIAQAGLAALFAAGSAIGIVGSVLLKSIEERVNTFVLEQINKSPNPLESGLSSIITETDPVSMLCSRTSSFFDSANCCIIMITVAAVISISFNRFCN